MRDNLKSERGQLSIEFIMIIGAAMFFFVALFAVFNSILSDRADTRTNEYFFEFAESIRQEIVLAHEASDGYERSFLLPETINKRYYDMEIEGSWIIMKSDDERVSLALSVLNVTGDLQMGTNIIRNVNGEVFLNP